MKHTVFSEQCSRVPLDVVLYIEKEDLLRVENIVLW
jgi:hypothetical protein